MQSNAVLTKNQAAAQLSVSIQTLDKMFKRGDLPRIQLSNRRIGVKQSDITDYLQSVTHRSTTNLINETLILEFIDSLVSVRNNYPEIYQADDETLKIVHRNLWEAFKKAVGLI